MRMTWAKAPGMICALALLAVAAHAAPIGDGLISYGNTRFKLNAADLNKDFMPSIARFDRLIASIEISNGNRPVGSHSTKASKP